MPAELLYALAIKEKIEKEDVANAEDKWIDKS